MSSPAAICQKLETVIDFFGYGIINLSEAKKLHFTELLPIRSFTAFRMTIPFSLVTLTRHSSSQVILSEAKNLLFT